MSQEEGAREDAAPAEESKKETFVVYVPMVNPRTLPGMANPQNKGAIDWGGHGLLAYGSNYTVVVVDTRNIQLVQCLDRHKAMVKKVLWGRDYLSQDKPSPIPARVHAPPDGTPRRVYGSVDLVSSDAAGLIVVWDVSSGRHVHDLQDGSKAVTDMRWVNQWDGNNHILAALHPWSAFVLWDTRSGAKLWKKSYAESLIAFDFDPFDASKMAFHCADCILFVEDFGVAKAPTSPGRKFYVSSPRGLASAAPRGSSGNLSAASKGSVGNLAAAIQDERAGAKDKLRRLVKDLVIGEVKPKAEDALSLSECLQVCYHRSLRYHLILLYPREVILLDLHINETVGIIPIGDKVSSLYLQVYSCKQRDILYSLHENGSVSAKVRRKVGYACSPIDAPAPSIASLEMNSDTQLEIGYDHRCASEPVRQTRGLQVLGMGVNPVCERRIALYLNSGKIVFVELLTMNSNETNVQHFALNLDALSPSRIRHRKFALNEVMPPLLNEVPIQPPGLRLLVTGVLPSVAAPITAFRMCPAITNRNWQQYSPLLAAGTTGGLVQIFNVATGHIEKELVIHSFTVRGIEWAGLKSFISYAFPNSSNAAANVRNEISLTDVLTGESVALRTDRGEEPPIDILRVSHLKQYFIVILCGGPVELWDLRSRTILKTLSKKLPVITALEWSPWQNSRRVRQGSKEDCSAKSGQGSQAAGATAAAGPGAKAQSPPSKLERLDSSEKIMTMEHFVFSDAESQLYHLSVEGHTLKEGYKIPPESASGTVTCLAYKADQIVQGDADGLLSVWNLRHGEAKRHSTSRGFIKKMRFAPGKGNMKLLVLYNDGVDLIDFKGSTTPGASFGFEKIAQLKCPRDMVKVLDIDWAASDRPILATQDGCLRIMNMKLSASSSPIVDYEFQDPVYCPALLPTEVAFKLRERLCWQPQDSPYTTDLTTDHGFTETQLALVNEQLSMVDEERLDCLRNPRFETAERCLIVAQLFGDETEIDLWTVVLYYLQVSRSKSNNSKGMPSDKSEGSFSSPTTAFDCKKFNYHPHLIPLDTCFDILQDPYTYQKLQLERVALHESRRGDYDHTKRVIQQLLLLGQSDRAVQLLLETDLNNPEYYTDAIKACLVATVQSTGAAQSTIKLVATNLIAHGTIWEGVQLLCLIGKGLDACRYLASYSRWGAAAWLARAVLPSRDACDVIRKWADHLSSLGHKEKAILVLISLEHWKGAHSLLSVFDPRRASLLAQACQHFDIDLLS